jgi:serine/threonine protein kinase
MGRPSIIGKGTIVGGEYRLDEPLGHGATGSVWGAVHTESGRRLALKLLHADRAISDQTRERFLREAQAAGRIDHPNVIDIYDVGQANDSSWYLVMERLEGKTLGQALDDSSLSLVQFVEVMRAVADALAAAHAVGVIHRDVKPHNIFLHHGKDGAPPRPVVVDFGISKLLHDDNFVTGTGAFLGSPRYMSPEHIASSRNLDATADLWAFGVILFHGLTGSWPHTADSYADLLLAIASTPPANVDDLRPELPEALRAVVKDCLRTNKERVQTAEAVRDRLAAVLAAGALDPAERLPAKASSSSLGRDDTNDTEIDETMTRKSAPPAAPVPAAPKASSNAPARRRPGPRKTVKLTTQAPRTALEDDPEADTDRTKLMPTRPEPSVAPIDDDDLDFSDNLETAVLPRSSLAPRAPGTLPPLPMVPDRDDGEAARAALSTSRRQLATTILLLSLFFLGGFGLVVLLAR